MAATFFSRISKILECGQSLPYVGSFYGPQVFLSSRNRPTASIAKRIVGGVLLGTLLAGCSASVTYQKASPDGTGIRYYEQSPYLLIYSDSKGGLKWQILYLPDPTKEMMAAPQVVGGQSQLTMYFQNGVLTGSSEVGDTTAIPKALIASIQSAIPLLAALSVPAPQQVPAPYIYKIVILSDGLHFVGSQGETGIKVPAK